MWPGVRWPLSSPHRREFSVVLVAGVCRVLTVALYTCGRVLILAVVFTPLVLEGGSLGPRAVFTILSLGWPLVVNLYAHSMLALFGSTESQVAASRMQVRKPVDLISVAERVS
jgi:hypothetical protein